MKLNGLRKKKLDQISGNRRSTQDYSDLLQSELDVVLVPGQGNRNFCVRGDPH